MTKEKNIKIAYDAKRFFSNYTGLGNYSRTLIKNLSEQFSNIQFGLYASKIKRNAQSEFAFVGKNIQIHQAQSKAEFWWRSRGIVKDLVKNDVEIFHGLSNELPIALNKSNIKSVVTIHDLIFKLYPNTYSKIDKIIYDFKFKYACKKADVVVAISECTKKDIVRFYNIPQTKIKVVYQSCDPIFYEETSADWENVLKKYQLPKKFILNVGSIAQRKNTLKLIKAYAQLVDQHDLPLVIVGRGGKYMKECKTFVAQKQLQNKVIFLHNINSNQELKQLYTAATFMVYPSLYEGFGLPVAEALLCKTAVITSNISSMPEAGGPGALYVNPHSIDDLSTKMENLLNDADLRNQLAEKGQQYAMNKFHPKIVSAQMLQVYEDLINSTELN